jgi:hypothetical protein
LGFNSFGLLQGSLEPSSASSPVRANPPTLSNHSGSWGKSLHLKVKVHGRVQLPFHPQPALEDRSFRGFVRSPTPGATPSGVPRVEGFTNPRLVGEHPAYRGSVRLHQPPIVCTAPVKHPPILQPLEPMLSIRETPRQLSRQLMHEIPHPVSPLTRES